MNAVILPIVLSVSFIGEVSAPPPVADDNTRHIRFHVHVQDFRGTPIRAGRQKDLLAAGVLTIVAVDGEVRSLTFSAADARDTIRTLADLYLP